MKIRNPILASAAFVAVLAAATAGEAAGWNAFSRLPETASPGAGLIFVQANDDSERFARIENAVRNLTGQVEELTHQLSVLQEQLRAMQQDVDFRLSDLEGGAGAPPAVASDVPQSTDTIGALSVDQPLAADAQLGEPPRPLGQLTLDAPVPGEQPLDLSSLAGGPALDNPQAPLAGADQQQQMVAVVPTGDPQADYDQAYAMIRNGRYDLAENAFRQFLGAYPSSELASEAQYWLGESLFARGDYARAAEEFRAGYKAYPKSRRGPDTLLKLGLSMAGLGYRDEACQMYAATLKQYPDMSNSLLQRVRNEQASANC